VRILLLESDPAQARNLRQLLWEAEGLSPEITWLDRRAFGREQLEDSGADVVLMALSPADREGHEALAAVRAHGREVPIIVLATSEQEPLARKAVVQGAQDYLVKGRWNASSLAPAIRSAIERHQARLDRGPEAYRVPRGRVLGFIGVKGGIGTTTLALNAAAVLSRNHSRVIAAELAPGCGGFALHLGRPRGKDFESLFRLDAGEIGERALAACLADLPFGVQVLFGPRAGESGLLHKEQVDAVLEAAARQADYLIVDLPPFSSSLCPAAVRGCDVVVLVVDREPACVTASQAGAELLRTWGDTESGLGVVIVNRTPLVTLVSVGEIRSQVKCEILGIVLHDMELASLGCQEAPFVVSHPDSLTSDSLAEIGKRLANIGQAADAFVL
jgi:MinD-like ATPase involved in chromosome partitioning or flagellar assembly/CheY-like chemotaxis protein